MKIDANPFGCTHHELEWCRRCTEFVLPERLVSILSGPEARAEGTSTTEGNLTATTERNDAS